MERDEHLARTRIRVYDPGKGYLIVGIRRAHTPWRVELFYMTPTPLDADGQDYLEQYLPGEAEETVMPGYGPEVRWADVPLQVQIAALRRVHVEVSQ